MRRMVTLSRSISWSTGWWRFVILTMLLTLWLHPVVADAQFTLTQITNTPQEGGNWSPSINADGTRIAFASDRDLVGTNADGNEEIFRWISPSTFIQITNTVACSNDEPSMNADGTRIAFMSNCDLAPGSPGNADGSNEIFLWVQGVVGFTQITNSSVASESPSINSDGTKIAFWSRSNPLGTNADGNEEIFRWASPATFTQITTTLGGFGSANLNPSINADGTRIAFSSSVDPDDSADLYDSGQDIYLYIQGSGISQITNTSGSGQNLSPRISGDGARIVFISSRNPDGGAPDGDLEVFLWTTPSTIIQITDTAGGTSVCPSINSNGTRIAFCYNGDLTSGNADLNREVFLWIEGGGLTQITDTTGGFNASPSINADGTRIAFSSNRDLASGSPGNTDGNEEIFLATSQEDPPVTAVPTLSEWAQIGMAALLVGGGLLAIRKRAAV